MKFITHTEIPTNVQDIIKVSLKRQKPSMCKQEKVICKCRKEYISYVQLSTDIGR